MSPSPHTNTPKRTAMGCGAVGSILFLSGAAALAAAVLRDAQAGAIAFGAVALALGIIGLLIGNGLRRQGRRIDALMAGEGLLAHWTYTQAATEGFVYISKAGVYHNAQYTEWSHKCVLEAVHLEEGDGQPMLVFVHILLRNSPQSLSPATRKRVRIPIPTGQEELAARLAQQLNPAQG